MGGNTLESMQQWRPSNLTVDVTILPEDIRRTADPCCSLYNSCFSPSGKEEQPWPITGG